MAAEEKKNSSIPSEEESHAGLRGEGESEDDFVARAVRSWDNWSPVERLGFLEWFDLEYAIFSGRICREQTSTLGKKDIKFKRDNCVEAINVSQRLLTQGGGNRKNESVEISRISRLRALLDGIIEVFQKFQGRRRAAGQEHKAGAGSAHVCRSVTTIFKDREKQETQRTKSQLIAWLAKNHITLPEDLTHRIVTLIRRFYWRNEETNMLARYIRAGLSRQSFELANGKKVRGYELCSVLPGLELVALPQATPDHLRSPTVLLFRADLKKSEHPEPLMPHLVLQRIALGLKDASEEDRLLFFDAFMEGVAIAHQQLGAFEVQRAVRAAATRPVISPPVVTLEAIAERMPTILEALGTLNIIEKTRLDNPFFQRELCEAVILFLKFSTTLSSQTIAALFALDEQLRFLPPHEKLLAAGQKAEPFIFEGRNVAAFPLREINDWFLVYGSHRARLAHRTRLAKPGEKPENKTLLLDKYYFLRTLLKQNLEMPDAIEKQAETLLQSVSRMIREYTPARKTRPEPAPAAAAAAAAAAAPKPVPTPEPESAPPEFETMPSEPSPG